MIGSTSHYTILFALDSSLTKLSPTEELVNEVKRAFEKYDNAESGITGMDNLESILKMLEMKLDAFELSAMKTKLNSKCGGSDIILVNDLLSILIPICAKQRGVELTGYNGIVFDSNECGLNSSIAVAAGTWTCTFCTFGTLF